MRYLICAAKRTAKNKIFIFTLLFIVISTVLISSVQRKISLPICGICSEDNSYAAERIIKNLSRDGYIAYDSKEAMLRGISEGEITAGALIKGDIEAAFLKGELNKMIELYVTPTTTFDRVSGMRILSRVAEEYSPYLSSNILKNLGIEYSPENIREDINKKMMTSEDFTFKFTSVEGESIKDNTYAQSLTYGAVAIFFFCLFALSFSAQKDRSYMEIRDRIGTKRAFLTIRLPSFFVKYAVCAIGSILSLLLSEKLYAVNTAKIIPTVLVYLLFLCGVAALIYAVLYNFSTAQLYVLCVCLLSLGVCPVFIDMSATIKIAEGIKMLLPPYFFYKAQENTLLWGAVAVVFTAVSMLLLYLREKQIPPRTRV